MSIKHRRHCGYLILKKSLINVNEISELCDLVSIADRRLINFLSWTSILAGREVASTQALM